MSEATPPAAQGAEGSSEALEAAPPAVASGEAKAAPAEEDGSTQAAAPETARETADIPPVQVCVRMRPLLGWERQDGHQCSAVALKEGMRGGVNLRPREGGEDTGRQRSFRFDAVIGPECTQEAAWDMTRVDSLVDKVVAGFHATVFAYGQTGSGKTHTMEGFAYSHHNGSSAPSAAAARPKVRLKATPPEQLGFVPRAVSSLFEKAEALQAKAVAEGRGHSETVAVKVSFLQIYNEQVYDLLNPVHTIAQIESKGDHSGLRVRWDAVKRQFFCENLFEYECQNADEVLEHYGTGLQHKQVASTGMNVASSRSHTVLVLKLVRRKGLRLDDGQEIPDAPLAPVKEVVSKLALVDLAGSERAAASNSAATGDRNAKRFHEAVNVNQSLFVLRRVITALSKKPDGGSVHVPYRESKLTSLLQHSIGGNGFLLMLACLSPSDKHYEENLSTLSYASQAASIKNAPTVNLDPKDRLIHQLEAKLAAAHAYILKHLGLEELPQELLDVGAADARGPSSARRSNRRVARSLDESGKAKSMRERRAHEGGEGRAPPHGSQGAGVRSASTGPSPFASRPPRERAAPRQASEGDELFAMADAIMASSSYGAGRRNPLRQGEPLTPRGDSAVVGSASGADFSGGRSAQAWNLRAASGRYNRPPMGPMSPVNGTTLPPVFSGGSSGSQAGPPRARGAAASQGSQSARGPPRSSAHAAAVADKGAASHAVESPLASRSTSAGTGPDACSWQESAQREAAAFAEAEARRGAAEHEAAQSALWDAVEELKRDKADLQAQLKAADIRSQEFQDELLRVQTAAAEAPTPPRRPVSGGADHADGISDPKSGMSTPTAAVAAAAEAAAAEAAAAEEARVKADLALTAAEAEREALAVERAAIQAERRALQEEMELLSRRASEGAERAASARGHARRAEEAAAASARTSEEATVAQAQTEKERDELRRERDSLKERLDIFYKALEEPERSDAPQSGSAAEEVEAAKIGEKIEKLHSQLVLECVQLRSETASLKKKKWVLRTVLAKGGEREGEAIDAALGQLRQEKRATRSPRGRAAPSETDGEVFAPGATS